MEHKPLPFDEFARLYESVSKLPAILNFSEFSQAVQANTPSRLENSNREVSVLLSISVGADGGLAGIRAILPELPPGMNVHGILEDESGNYLGSIPQPMLHPECMAAAERAALVLRFAPAERNGKPIAFPDFRIGVGFSARPARGSDVA
ncbi:MAG: energy transducer TonB [Candidatus Methylomirabilaceae bacterium]